jgi:hypothetical protein
MPPWVLGGPAARWPAPSGDGLPLPLIEERLRLREKTVAEAELSAARWWVSRLEGSLVANHLVENSKRSPREVAADVLRALGWLD